MKTASKMKTTFKTKTTSKKIIWHSHLREYYLKFFWRPRTSTATGQLILNLKCYQVFKTEMELHMMNIIYAALPMHAQTEKTTFSTAKLYIYTRLGSRDLFMFIDEAHTTLGLFPVFFPCILPTPICGIFNIKRIDGSLWNENLKIKKDIFSDFLVGKVLVKRSCSNLGLLLIPFLPAGACNHFLSNSSLRPRTKSWLYFCE